MFRLSPRRRTVRCHAGRSTVTRWAVHQTRYSRSGRSRRPRSRAPSINKARAFRGFRFPAEVILWTVRWYLQFPVSYRDLELMLADRSVEVGHTTTYRWVQRFAPELEKRVRRRACSCAAGRGTSTRP
jgi:hypothetical protein